MAEIKSFNGYRAKLASPEDLGKVAAPPYDMLNKEMIDDFYALDPHNTVRIIQNKPEDSDSDNKDRHIRAAKLFEEWIEQGIWEQDSKPGLYVYRQKFSVPVAGETKEFVRTGISVLVKLTPFDEGVVIPHEKTLSGPKQDRLDLLEAIKCNTGQLFGLASDDGVLYQTITTAETTGIEGTFKDANNVTHELSRIVDAKAIGSICELMKDRTIVIADGHHRYETTLNYSRENGSESAKYVMMTLVSMADPGLIIRPFHRLVKRVDLASTFKGVDDLSRFFTVKEIGSASFNLINDYLASRIHSEMLFVEASSQKAYGLSLSDEGRRYLKEHADGQSSDWTALNVSQINKLCVESIMNQPLDGHVLHEVMDYVNDPQAAYDCAIDSQGFIGCFFIHPITITKIMDIVSGGERMPQKSTNFYPKLYSGLVFNKLADA